MSWLLKYKEEIDKGNIIVGQEMYQGLEMYIRDLDNPKYVYDTREADFRIEFIETFCKHSKDPFAGMPFKLMLWQKAFIEVLYSFKIRATGRDRFKKAILLIARKNGKSTLCAALAFCELMVGGAGKDVICSANNDEQSKIIFEEIANMRDMFDPKGKRVKRNRNEIRYTKVKSKVKRVSDRKKNILGLNINFAICDETNELLNGDTPSKLIKSMSLKKNPKFINITTEGFVADGYLDKELEKARMILDGERSDESAESMLVWLYTQDSEQEIWVDEKSWQKSNPSLYEVKDPNYLREQLAESRLDRAERLQTLCFDFNLKQNSAEAWLLPEDYDYEQEEWSLEEFRGQIAIGAVDLAFTNDLCCAKIMLMRQIHPKTGEPDKHKYIFTRYFIPESKVQSDKSAGAKYEEWIRQGLIEVSDGNRNDLTKVADWFVMLFREYGIKTFVIGYDDRFSTEFLNRLDEYGWFEAIRINQDKGALSDPMCSCEADFKDQLINYGRNPIDRWCFANTVVETDSKGMIKPAKIPNQPSRKIDGTATLVDLYAVLKLRRNEYMNNIQ